MKSVAANQLFYTSYNFSEAFKSVDYVIELIEGFVANNHRELIDTTDSVNLKSF